jgi:hypothetical protein
METATPMLTFAFFFIGFWFFATAWPLWDEEVSSSETTGVFFVLEYYEPLGHNHIISYHHE